MRKRINNIIERLKTNVMSDWNNTCVMNAIESAVVSIQSNFWLSRSSKGWTATCIIAYVFSNFYSNFWLIFGKL